MKSTLQQFLNQEELNKKQIKKKKVTIKNTSEMVEVVEKTILVEDGRQLLTD